MIWTKKQPDWAIEQDFSWNIIDRDTAISELVANGASRSQATAKVKRWEHEKKHGPTPLGLDL